MSVRVGISHQRKAQPKKDQEFQVLFTDNTCCNIHAPDILTAVRRLQAAHPGQELILERVVTETYALHEPMLVPAGMLL